MSAILSVRDLAVAYGHIEAVKGVSFDLNAGEITALVGANGAGKSSTLKGIMGLAHPRGEVLLAGERLHKLPTHAIAARGLALVPEGRGVFGRLTVAENLDMGAYARRDRAGIQADLARAYDLFPRLAERRAQLAGTLSGGEQQMLAIARALMGRPRLLLLDEPSSGLNTEETEDMGFWIEDIKHDLGITVIMVEHDMGLVSRVSDRVLALNLGEVLTLGTPQEVQAHPGVIEAYLGGVDDV